jgi:predicted RNase H-like HicB family nuclease
LTTYTFRIVVEPDEDRWRAYCPALEEQGAATWGPTRKEALQHIREVLEMTVAAGHASDRCVRVPTERPSPAFGLLPPLCPAVQQRDYCDPP